MAHLVDEGRHEHPCGMLTVEKFGDGTKISFAANNWEGWSADWFFLADGRFDGTGTAIPDGIADADHE